MAPNCVTNCILKTKQTDIKGDDSTIKVYAHGHTSVRRVEYVTVHGDDGKNHRVPVYWDEYFPVTGTGQFHIGEDNTSLNEDAASQHQRIDYINKVLQGRKNAVVQKAYKLKKMKIRCGDNGIFRDVPRTEEEKRLSKIAHDINKAYPFDGKYVLADQSVVLEAD